MEEIKKGDDVSVTFKVMDVYENNIKCKGNQGAAFVFSKTMVNKLPAAIIQENDSMKKKEYKPGDKVMAEFLVKKQYSDGQLLCSSKLGGDFHLFPESIVQPFEPREMLVSNTGTLHQSRKVIGQWNNWFIAEETHTPTLWRNAKEVPQELENGKVYSTDSHIVYKTVGNSGFGFVKGEFVNKNNYFLFTENPHLWKEYPLEDFVKLLIKEANKRGFKKDVWVDRKELGKVGSRIVELESDNIETYHNSNFDIVMNGKCIFRNGNWATIID